jgi:multidrug efflux pump subunit AcrA (membrane-fusion protein)
MDEKQSQLVDNPQSENNPPYTRPEFIAGRGTKPQRKPLLAGLLGIGQRSSANVSGTLVGRVKGAKGKRAWLRQHQALVASVLLLLIVLGTLGMVLYNHFVVLSVTAFQVGERQSVPHFVGGGGMTFARQQFNLTSPLPTRVAAVLVNVGDRVNANQPLLKVDQTSLHAQLKMAQDNVESAESYLNSVAGAFPYNPVTVAAAQQALREARSKYEAMQMQVTSGSITSPITGVITMLKAVPGESYGANQPLLTVVDPQTVIVHAKVPLSSLNQVAVGMDAEVTPPAIANVKLQGKVVSIVPQADPQTDTFEVWVQATNDNMMLLPGMSAFVSIQGQTNAFVLPRLAVLNPDREASIFLIRNGHAVMKSVTVVGRNESSVFVDSGLTPGDTIVLLPLDKVHEGQGLKVNGVQH